MALYCDACGELQTRDTITELEIYIGTEDLKSGCDLFPLQRKLVDATVIPTGVYLCHKCRKKHMPEISQRVLDEITSYVYTVRTRDDEDRTGMVTID